MKIFPAAAAISLCVLFAACANPADPVVPDVVEEVNDVPSGLDRTFESEALGMIVHYPSSVTFDGCDALPVSARETEHSVEFTVERTPECDVVDTTIAVIHAQRATSEEDVRRFVGRVFPPHCSITEKNTYEERGDRFHRFFLKSTNDDLDSQFECEFALWNETAGVVYFSSLKSKTGGSYEWPSAEPIDLGNGSVEHGWDFIIMDAIRFPR